jgi:hypothetical protein
MMSRRFPHHDEVIALHGVLTATWAKAEPESEATKYPASDSETFLDMARAVTEAGFHQPPKPGERVPTLAQDDEVVVPADLFSTMQWELRRMHADDRDWVHILAQAKVLHSDQQERSWKTGGNPAPTRELIPATDEPASKRISNQRRALRQLEAHVRWAEQARKYAESNRAAIEEQLGETNRELRAENARLIAQVASLTAPQGPAPREAAPDDFDFECYLNDAQDFGEAVAVLIDKYDIAVTNNEPRWQGGVYLRHMGDLMSDIIEAAKHLHLRQGNAGA